MDQRTRKLITLHKALHPRDDTERLYVPKRERRRGLAGFEDSEDTSIQRLEGYIEKRGGILITQGSAERQLPENKSRKKNNY